MGADVHTWTREQVEAFSPDASSLKAAGKLLSKTRWSELSVHAEAVWGKCQGSGKKPYLTRVDLRSSNDIAFKCSCPSRKFPCKHGLALMLLLAQDAAAFAPITPSEAPDWVQEWLDSRAQRQEKKAAKEENSAPVDNAEKKAAQAKRVEAREKKVLAGLEELELWLHDLIRAGLMELRQKPYDYFEGIAARLVDAQAKGLATRVRALQGYSIVDAEQAKQMLVQLGHLQLLIHSYRRQEHVPDAIRADIRRAIGWNDDQKELRHHQGVRDRWLVLAKTQEDEDNLCVMRTWFWGLKSGKVALDLQFAFRDRPFAKAWHCGSALDAEMVFFPSNYPQRALMKEADARVIHPIQADEMAQVAHYSTVTDMLTAYGEALAQQCWLEHFPVILTNVTPHYTTIKRYGDHDIVLADEACYTIPLRCAAPWQVIAFSGGYPMTVVGTWNGQTFHLLSVWHENRLTTWERINDTSVRAKHEGSHSISEAMSVASLLGTRRREVPHNAAMPENVQHLLSDKPSEAQLLHQAVAQHLSQQAGRKAILDIHVQVQRSQQQENAKAAEETLAMVNAWVTKELESLTHHTQTSNYPTLVWALRLIQREGKRIPHALLARMIRTLNHTELEALLPVLGARGRWLLVQQDAAWREYFDTPDAEDAASWQKKQARFATATAKERVYILRSIRATHASLARDMLRHDWKNNDAQQRRGLLATFEAALSLDDEAFLEEALQDQSKNVRSEAARLLALLPQSAYVQRMKKRLARMVYRDDNGIHIDYLKPPTELEGITQETLSDITLVDKNWWLFAIVSRVPIDDFWVQDFSLDALDVESTEVKSTLTKPQRTALLQGWIESCVRFSDQVNALKLWKRYSNKDHARLYRLVEVFDATRTQEAAHIALDKGTLDYQQEFFMLLFNNDAGASTHHVTEGKLEFTPSLREKFLALFSKMLPNWHKNRQASSLVRALGWTLPCDFYDALYALKPDNAKHALLPAYREMLEVLEYRAKLYQAIRQP